MNFEEKLDRLDGVFANDMGCASSGIKDDGFKREMRNNTPELESLLTALARQYLNANGYTIEDIAVLLQWAENEFDLIYT